MATGLNYTVTIKRSSDRFDRARAAFRDPKRLLARVGTLATSSAVRRLSTVLKDDSEVRTGRLGASLGRNGAGNIFELSNDHVRVGTNLPYAAQVHYGGTIKPKNVKALAIPLNARLARQGIGPREFDPSGELLKFVPYKGSKPNIIGLLVADEDIEFESTIKRGKRAGQKRIMTIGEGPLFALASEVTQEPRPYLYFDDADIREIHTKLYPEWLAGR